MSSVGIIESLGERDLFTKKLRERTRRESFDRAATAARILAQQLASFFFVTVSHILLLLEYYVLVTNFVVFWLRFASGKIQQ